MVASRALSLLARSIDVGGALAWLQSDSAREIPLNRLDGQTRAKVLAALAGLVILGLGMMALIWLGARVTRRYMFPLSVKPKNRPASMPPQDDWASKPLVDDGLDGESPADAPARNPNA